jgi:D-3-phosphoglycerate dehydrogenase
MQNLSDIDIIFIRLRFKFTKELLQKAPQLKYILTATTGLDHIDVDYFESTGGKIISLKGEVDFLGSIPSTAEHTWTLLLALLKKLPTAFDDVKSGNWNRDIFKGNNLSGKKIGILGLGRVGKQVAHFAEAFAMEVAYFDIIKQSNKYKCFNNPGEMFGWADILSIHIPYTNENGNFVNEGLLQKCQPNAIIINTSRGNVWDENVLVSLLKNGKIKGIATDVLQNEFEKETISQNPLVLLANQKYNIIITPHIAGATRESMALTEDFIVDKFIATIK